MTITVVFLLNMPRVNYGLKGVPRYSSERYWTIDSDESIVAWNRYIQEKDHCDHCG
jgi:hypothetical protein